MRQQDRGYFWLRTRTSKERPDHCDHRDHGQRQAEDELPGACALRHQEIALWIGAVSKNQAETVGMAVKNQNAPYLVARCIRCRQSARLSDDEDLLRVHSGPATRRRKASKVRTNICDRPNETRREWYGSITGVFPFHDLS